MSHWSKGVLLLFVIFLLTSVGSGEAAEEFEKVGTIGAQFLKIGIGARATAMGGAFTAVADDASSLYWNPAGIARLHYRALSFSHTAWFADIQLNQIGYIFSVPFLPGAIGIQARSLSMDRQPVRTVFRPDGEGTTFDAGDLALGFSYARSLTDKFSTGISLHYIQSNLAEWEATGFSFDFGTLYDTGYRSLTIGMSIQSIGSEMVYIEEAVKLPTVFRVGMAMNLFRSGSQSLLASGEFQHPPDNEERANTGFEYSFNDFIFLRSGWFYRYDQERFAVGGGLKVPTGLGDGATVDYSFTENNDLPAVHRLTLEVRF
jgi:hypothetical protein